MENRYKTDLEFIYSKLKNNIPKKMQEIREYLNDKYGEEFEFNNKDEFLNTCKDYDLDDEDIEYFYRVFHERHPYGFPYFLYTFEAVSFDNLQNRFEQEYCNGIDKGQKLAYENFSIYQDDDFFTISFDYKQYHTYTIPGGDVQRNSVIAYGKGRIVIEKRGNLIYVSIGDRHIANDITNDLAERLDDIFKIINPFYLYKSVRLLEYNGDGDLDQQTMLVLRLIEKQIRKNNIDVLDYKHIGFLNSASQKVKKVKLDGTNLLTSFEAIEQIRQGNKIVTVKLRLRKIIEGDNEAVLANVHVNFQGTIKLTITDATNYDYDLHFVKHIYDCIGEILLQGISAEDAKEIIEPKLNIFDEKERFHVNQLLEEIRKKLLHNFSEMQIHEKINAVINDMCNS